MTRALVLGGGGPVGIGWESGLIAGLADKGVRLAEADLVVGTSAGSVVGAALRLGIDARSALTTVAGDDPSLVTAPPVDPAALGRFMEALARAATSGQAPESARADIGRMALEADTIDEDVFVGLFAPLSGAAWPAGFTATAVDATSGELMTWTAESGAPLERAIASSCAVPGIFPPVTVNGRHYVDGGVRTALNADLAAGHDVVVAVSCFALSLPPGMDNPLFSALASQVEAELDAVRARGSLGLIVPSAEYLEISGWGLQSMDFGRVEAAYDAGVRQGAEEAARIGPIWQD
jgi:NTE family protein